MANKPLIAVGLVLGTAMALYWAKKAHAAPLPPEPGKANLYGKVLAANNGAALSGVAVNLGGIETQTDSGGNYTILDIEPGSYALEFTKGGYEPLMLPGMILIEGNNLLDVQMEPIPGVDLIAGNFTIHNINNIVFSSVGVEEMPYSNLLQTIVLNQYAGLTVHFTWQGTIYTIDYGNILFLGLWWEPNFDTTVAPAFYTKYAEVPVSGNRWASPFTMSVPITDLSNPGNGYAPGPYSARISIICPGGGPGTTFRIKGILML